MAKIAVLVGALALAIVLLPSAAASQPQGPVTIVTAIDFSSLPFHGTFVVTVGSSILGCSAGHFFDTTGVVPGELRKVFSCDSGSGTGDTFTFLFDLHAFFATGGHASGHWMVLRGTGFFATLRGQGDFSVVFCFGPNSCPGFLPPPSGIETLTGKVHFE